MALIICRKCQAKISDQAAACPKCGHSKTAANPGKPLSAEPGEPEASAGPRPVPKLPIFLGTAAIILGLLSSGVFGAFTYALIITGTPFQDLAVGTSAILAFLGFLQLPAGIGILMHKNWGRLISQPTTFGTVILVGLCFAHNAVSPTVLSAGQLAGGTPIGIIAAVWAIALNFGLNAKSIRKLFTPKDSSN